MFHIQTWEIWLNLLSHSLKYLSMQLSCSHIVMATLHAVEFVPSPQSFAVPFPAHEAHMYITCLHTRAWPRSVSLSFIIIFTFHVFIDITGLPLCSYLPYCPLTFSEFGILMFSHGDLHNSVVTNSARLEPLLGQFLKTTEWEHIGRIRLQWRGSR